MKNLDTVEKLEVFILYVVMHPEKYDVPGDVKLTNLLTHFKKIPEKKMDNEKDDGYWEEEPLSDDEPIFYEEPINY